jgi:hypothetical protein
VGLQVVGHDGDVVVGAQGVEEADGGVAHVVDEVVGVGGELEQHDGGDGGLRDAHGVDLLLDAIFEDEEVLRP